MNPGDLRHRITIKSPTGTTQNQCGEDVPGYVNFATVWAAAEPLRGKEYFEAQKIQSDTTYRFRIRYLTGLTPDMLVSFKGKDYDIQSIININELNKEIHLMCSERPRHVRD